jgi:hypothetical protein
VAGAGLSAQSRFEFASDADPALNYCLWPYERPQRAEDKFRSLNLLLHSFEHAGIDPRAHHIVEAIRDAIGPFRTVFGVKRVGERLAWEFYFYDYQRRERGVSASRVLQAIGPWIACDVPINEQLPYFMFSLDLDHDIACGRRALDLVHLYVGNPGSAVSSGIAYGVRRDSTTLENFYFFFDARTQLDEVAGKVGSSAHFDAAALPLDAVIVPELRDCRTICVANKQTHDCIYFSGVDVGQLLWFLRWLGYPPGIVDFVERHRGQLDHLLYDVGVDYRMRGGRLEILKSGYYGVF